MSSLFVAFLSLVASSFLTRAALQAEILALRHQLTVLQKNAPPRLRLQRSDRLLWVLLLRWWPGWRWSLHIVRPDTVIAWHCRAFAWYWTRKSRRRPGRPNVPAEIRDLIRNMSQANPLRGAPRIHGELLKSGIEVAQSTVAKISSRPAEATFPDVENLLDQSYGPNGLHRLLCGADGELPGSVCVRCVIACAAPRAALPGRSEERRV